MGNDETGFTAIPGGSRSEYDGSYDDIHAIAIWWSPDGANTCSRSINYSGATVERLTWSFKEGTGLSVRCVKD